jgi:predicted DNA-binding WGR domain protein/very-short-patch-repair endonuclease
MRMNFGPINQTGGEKRLNVAFSRAKHHMCVVASVRHDAITNDYNDGARCLKSYLRYADAASRGDAAAAERVLREVAAWRDLAHAAEERRSAAVAQIAAALAARGYAVEERVGMSHFRCDLAVRRHGDPRHRLGILVDGEAHYRQDDLLERDLMRPQLLRAFGWSVRQVLSADWYRRRHELLEELVQQVEMGDAGPDDDGAEDGLEDPWAELDAVIEAAGPSAPPPPPGAAGVAPPRTEPGSAPAPAGAGARRRRFELVGGSSRKFWEVAVDGCAVVVHFGRIGTAGQTQQKLFSDPTTASRTAERLVREKLAKGYVERSDLGAA